MVHLPFLMCLGYSWYGRFAGVRADGMGFGVYPRGSIYTTIMELGPKKPSPLWFLGPNSIIVVYMDPLGILFGPELSNAISTPNKPLSTSKPSLV